MNQGHPEVDRLLTEANVHRVRKQWAEAEAKCRQALLLNPHDPYARELLGDLLEAQGQYDKAKEIYRSLLQDFPGRASVETKLARLIIKTTPAPGASSSVPQPSPVRKKSGIIAVILSLSWPGLGQFYLGQWIKGLIFAGLGLVLFTRSFSAFITPLVTSLQGGLGTSEGDFIPSRGVTSSFIGSGTLFGFLFFLVYLIALVDILWGIAKINRSSG
jgi:TM2 domain-containing membrane protein YozV